MMKKALPFVFLLCSQFVWADLAPPDGYVHISRSVILETDDDLSGYRFFVESGGSVREVTITKGEQTVVPPMGGGARYLSGTLYAVPKKAVASLPSEPTDEQKQKLASDLFDKAIPGAIELLQHSFRAQVPKADASKVTDAEYRLLKTTDGIKAEKLPVATPHSPNSNSTPQTVSVQSDRLMPVGAGLLIAALLIGGGLLLSRSRQKSEQ